MALNQLATPEPVIFAADLEITRRLRTVGYWVASLGALVGYFLLLTWILSTNTAKVYGFAVNHDLPTLIEITLQIGPMLAALFMVLLLPLKDRVIEWMPGCEQPGRRVANMLAVSAATAVITTCATAIAILTVCEFRPGALSATTALWVAGEYVFDLTLIGVFTSTLFAVKRRVWAAMPLFLLYIAIVVTAGPALGITSYIGFGSTVPVTITTYATAPLYDGAAWMLRGYWTCVTLFLLAALYGFDRPGRSLLSNMAQSIRGNEPPPRTALRLMLVLGVACIGAGVGLVKLQAYGLARYQTPSPTTLSALPGAGETTRVHLNNFDLRLDYSQGQEQVRVDSTLSFRNGAQTTRSAYFQLPGLMAPEHIEIHGAGDYRLVNLGKYLQVQFSKEIAPAQELRIVYRGSVQPAGAFDLAVKAKLLGGAFFLTDADILLAARSAACVASLSGPCANTENYLMADRATGRVAVIAPAGLGVVSSGDEITRQLSKGIAEHIFTVASPQMATFMVACARFQETVASTASGVNIRVLRSAAAADRGIEAPIAQNIVSFYETLWPAYPHKVLKIIETPTPLGEALAFDGEVAISDKIIASRSPLSGVASNLLEFVMAHEIAHQWWGFNIVPANSPGRLFVLESIPQFAAYKFLSHRGILSEDRARQYEERRYQAAHARLGKRETALIRSEVADEVSYNKGPFALLSIDQMAGGSLMNRLGGLISADSYNSHGTTGAEPFAAALISDLPAANREAARGLLYTVSEPPRQ